MKQMLIYLINNMIMCIVTTVLILLNVAFLTLYERKILSYIHYRKGPNKVSLMGILQPFSDAMKLLTKEFFIPKNANYIFYLLTPLMMLFLTLSMWLIYPHMTNFWQWNNSYLYFLCLMSLGVYGLIMAGWSSNSSFSMLGSIRSIAQSISYEMTFAMSFMIPFSMINTINIFYLNIYHKYMIFFITFWPAMIIMFLSMMAEINRTPFDLSEGESELVSGFNVEYSSHSFTLIFLSEYSNILIMMFLFSLMNFNLNFNKLIMFLFTIILSYLIIWVRATLPRIRYDFLMYFCWFYMLPYILMIFMFYLIFMKTFIKFILN